MLQDLDLALNRLSGFIPDEFYNLSSLVRVDFNSQGQADTTVQPIRDKDAYRSCRLSNGAVGNPHYNDDNLGLEGAFLENVWRLQGLREIVLNENYFSGTIASEIGNIKRLGENSVSSVCNFFLFITVLDVFKLRCAHKKY